MSTWAARAKLHLSQKGATDSAISDVTPLLALMTPPSGALHEKPESENDSTHNGVAAKLDTDRWCWPHSSAMNGTEIEKFLARVSLFAAKGVTHDDGEGLADNLVIRDREDDDRRLCLECRNISGYGSGSWRCREWKLAGIALKSQDAGLPSDFVRTLQRCDGFKNSIN